MKIPYLISSIPDHRINFLSGGLCGKISEIVRDDLIYNLRTDDPCNIARPCDINMVFDEIKN